MIVRNQGVIVHRDPFRGRRLRLGNVVFLGILVPLLKCPEGIAVVERVVEPQTEAGDRESKRPHFGVLSM